jgi:SAM-dependent methyltransferase
MLPAVQKYFRSRRNMCGRIEEEWRPPLFHRVESYSERFFAAARRLLDLQAASIRSDIAPVLKTASGAVLDVGCGAQPYRCLLPPDTTYTGIDIVDVKRRFGYEMPDTLYYTGDSWPIANHSVSMILCTETLEHVCNPSFFLSEAYRALKPGGSLVLTVPFAARWHFIPYDYWRFTPSCLKHLLEQAGFRNVAVYARGDELTVACYKMMALPLSLLLRKSPGSISNCISRLLGIVLLPMLGFFAIIGNVSLRTTRGGDDCLGYTVLAEKGYE